MTLGRKTINGVTYVVALDETNKLDGIYRQEVSGRMIKADYVKYTPTVMLALKDYAKELSIS